MARKDVIVYEGTILESDYHADEYELYIDSDSMNEIIGTYAGKKVRMTIEQIE